MSIADHNALVSSCQYGFKKLIEHLIQYKEVDMSFTTHGGETLLEEFLSGIEEGYKNNEILEIVDLLINKAKEQNKLKELLISKNTSESLSLFFAAFIEDKDTACKLIDNLIMTSNLVDINLLKYSGNLLVASLKRDDDNVQDIFLHLLKYTDNLDHKAQGNLIKEALDYCASKNLIDDAKFIIDQTKDIISAEYKGGSIEIIAPARITSYHLGLEGINFETKYEDYLTKILGEDPFVLEEE